MPRCGYCGIVKEMCDVTFENCKKECLHAICSECKSKPWAKKRPLRCPDHIPKSVLKRGKRYNKFTWQTLF